MEASRKLKTNLNKLFYHFVYVIEKSIQYKQTINLENYIRIFNEKYNKKYKIDSKRIDKNTTLITFYMGTSPNLDKDKNRTQLIHISSICLNTKDNTLHAENTLTKITNKGDSISHKEINIGTKPHIKEFHYT